MRSPRVFTAGPLRQHERVVLAAGAASHITRVLRKVAGDSIRVFDGEGGEFAGIIVELSKTSVVVELGPREMTECESPLAVHLVQAIGKGDKIDFVIQKAVELGAASIQPATTARTMVKLAPERAARRAQHWQGIIVGACEQCGRNQVPLLHPLRSLEEILSLPSTDTTRLVLEPSAGAKLAALSAPEGDVQLLIGPEGGFSEAEITRIQSAGFAPVSLGPRVLRMETAALAALASMQTLWGDFAH